MVGEDIMSKLCHRVVQNATRLLRLHCNKNIVSRLREVIVPFNLKLLNLLVDFLPKAVFSERL